MRKITWTLEDHLCRHCGGRVLRSASGAGATGGGNPIFRCADCGSGAAAMGPAAVCWCGFNHRRADVPTSPYQCRALSDAKNDPTLHAAFLANGFDSMRSKTEVGVYMPEHYRRVMDQMAVASKQGASG